MAGPALCPPPPPECSTFLLYVVCSGVRGLFRYGPAKLVTHSSTALVFRDLFVEWETISHTFIYESIAWMNDLTLLPVKF